MCTRWKERCDTDPHRRGDRRTSDPGPRRACAARGRQGATLRRLAHEKLIDPDLGKLLDALIPYGERLPYDSDDAALIRVAAQAIRRTGDEDTHATILSLRQRREK